MDSGAQQRHAAIREASVSLRALTLWRPWPAAICYLGKRVENRTWRPAADMLGHDLAIHAGQKIDTQAVADIVHGYDPEGRDLETSYYREALARGVIPGSTGVVAVVRVVGFIDATRRAALAVVKNVGTDRDHTRSWWWEGPVGWVLDRVRVLPEPVPCRGAQGLWVVPTVVEVRVNEQLRKLAETGRAG